MVANYWNPRNNRTEPQTHRRRPITHLSSLLQVALRSSRISLQKNNDPNQRVPCPKEHITCLYCNYIDTMPKVGKNPKLKRLARRAAATTPLPVVTPAATEATQNPPKQQQQEEESNVPNTQTLSRGQRKRNAKREQYLRKEKMILSTLMLQKQEEQKKRIDGLDAIRDALMNTTKESSIAQNDDTANTNQHQPNYGSNKAKKHIMANEVERLGLVLQHPQFKQDPFATIQEHLRNSLANQREQLDAQDKEQAKKDQEKEEEKKRLKKERLQGVKKSRKKYKPRRTV